MDRSTMDSDSMDRETDSFHLPPAGDHHPPTTPAGTLPPALIPMQGDLLRVPRVVLARQESYEKATKAQKQRRLMQGQIRPMSLPIVDARETDRIFNVERGIKFNILQIDAPTGDEYRVHQRQSFVTEEYTDDKGTTLTRKLTPEQILTKLRKESLQTGFEDERKTLDDLLPQRIQVAWRIVREMGRWRNLVLKDEMLIDALKGTNQNPDPWVVPTRYEPPRNPEALRNIPQVGLDIIVESEFVPAGGQYSRLDLDTMQRTWYPGMSLMPPPVPVQFEDNLDAYQPENDVMLGFYVKLLQLVVKKLGIEHGSKESPDYGRYGLIGMTDVDWVRFVFPTRLQIVAWEEIVVEETLEILIREGPQGTRKYLKNKYGYVEQEMEALIRLANIRARTLAAADIEEQRGLMLLKLDDFVTRARGALDLRNELAALKQIAIVGGLSKEQDNPLLDSMIDAVTQIAAERKADRELAARDAIVTDARVIEGD